MLPLHTIITFHKRNLRNYPVSFIDEDIDSEKYDYLPALSPLQFVGNWKKKKRSTHKGSNYSAKIEDIKKFISVYL